MTDSTHSANFDLAPVFDLLASLREQDDAVHKAKRDDYTLSLAARPNGSASSNSPAKAGGTGADSALGDFQKLWEYLGVKPPSAIPTFEYASAAAKQDDPDVYASDGALYYPPSSKNVRWRDQELEDADLADTYPDSPPTDEPLTKNQRKKRNRKARKDAEYAELAQNLRRKKASVEPVESGDDSETTVTPARLAGTHSQLDKAVGGKAKTKKKKAPADASSAHLFEEDSTNKSKAAAIVADGALRPAQVPPPKAPIAPSTPHRVPHEASLPSSSTRESAPVSRGNDPSTPEPSQKQSKQWPVARPYEELQRSVIPGIVPHTDTKVQRNSAAVRLPSSIATYQQNSPTRARHVLKPLNHKDSADRNWNLLLKLIHNFPEDRKSLLSPLQLSINKPQAGGIHVFIDASNILIGFIQYLKKARGIPEETRVPRVYPAFHAIALLLERRRPTAKRVLVGSSPRVEAYDEAEEVGYDAHILEKVYKAKEMTEKQRRYAMRATGRKSEYSSGYDSASDGPSLPTPQPKWVEQAVDELLHLKMAESLMDVEPGTDTKRPTMVLATGDAAEAEYSSGFLKMVMRALEKGWNVEVAAWSTGLSYEYKNLAKRSKWAGRFHLITLDDYAEELFPPEPGE